MTLPLSPLFLAAAPDAASPTGLFGSPLVFPVLMLVTMYFILIRPQRRRQKEQDLLLKGLVVGNEVVTIGGAHGVITNLKEKTVMVRVADGVKVEYDRSAIATVIKKDKVVDTTVA